MICVLVVVEKNINTAMENRSNMKKNRTESQRTLFVLWVALALVLFTIIVSVLGNIESKKMLKSYEDALASIETKLIYIGRPTCTYCQQMEPILKDLSARYNFEYFYLNTDTLSQTQLEDALNKADIDLESFGTPYFIVVKNGKKVIEQAGLQQKSIFFNFLKTNGVIASDAELTFENQEMLSNYNEIISSTTNKLVFAGGVSCLECSSVDSSLLGFGKDFNLEYFFLNYDEMTSAELQTELSKLGITDINNTTPYVMVVNNGKLVARYSGDMTEKGLFEFVKSYNLIPSNSEMLIEKIGYSGFQTLFNGNKEAIVVLGRVGCSYCEAAYPILKEIIKDYNITINYVELTYLSGDEQGQLSTILKDVEGGSTLSTPNMLIVKDGKVVDNSVGFINKDTYLQFLRENNMLK